MQFLAVVNRFIVKAHLNSIITNDLERFFFPENGHDFRLSHFNMPVFYLKYLTMHKVQMNAGAISKLLYGLCVCKAKARGLSSHTGA